MACPVLPKIDLAAKSIVEQESSLLSLATTSSGYVSHESQPQDHQGDNDYHHGDNINDYNVEFEKSVNQHFSNCYGEEELLVTQQRIKYLKEKLDGEGDLIHELMDSMNEIRKISETPTKVEIVRPRKECMPEKDLMNYLHKLHASNVPEHRRDLLEEMHSNHNLSCKQLSIILSQLRYLAEKDQTVRLFCPHILDPENLPDLVQSLEDDSFQDKTIITSIVNCIADSL